jgi:hypothetical protein
MGLSMALAGFFTRLISGIACGVVYFNWKFKHSHADEIVSNTVVNEPVHKNENDETTQL